MPRGSAQGSNLEDEFRRAEALYDDGQLLATFDLLVGLATTSDHWLDRTRDRLLDVVARLKISYMELPREREALDEIDRLLHRRYYSFPDFSEGLARKAREIIADSPLRTGWGHAPPEPHLPRPISRTPHLDVRPDEPIRPGISFEVSIYLDGGPRRPGETGVDLSAPEGSRVEVELLMSSHFLVLGSPTCFFVLTDAPRQELPPFRARCVDPSDWDDDAPAITAIFYVDGRPCGRVGRLIEVVNAPTGKRPTGDVEASIEIGSNGLAPADLTITVVATPENDGRHYWCSISTPHLERYRTRVTDRWHLPQVTSDLVAGYMHAFTAPNTGAAQLTAELSGAGIKFFEAAPRLFRQVIWELIDAQIDFRSIAIVSDEPYIPWELMIPNRVNGGRHEDREKPLGVEFDVGRWTDRRIIAPPRDITLLDSHVVAPTYRSEMALEKAGAEAAMVIAHYPGDVVSPADFETVAWTLGTVGRSLIHFVCHGDDEGGPVQSLHLECGAKLTSSSILRVQGIAKLFASRRPVVFLNACEVGRGSPALVGPNGFASSFIRLGAAAVIAPLWSVEDADAHEVAREFYGKMKANPDLPLSRIVAGIRAKAYDGQGTDTYAAYCFYGDPCATANRRVPAA